MTSRVDVLLANRSYLDHATSPGSAATAPPIATGGLVTAVRSVVAPWDGTRGTTWIGAGRGRHDREWTDQHGFEILQTSHGAMRHRRLYFTDNQWHAHYATVSNGFLWPLLHLVRLDLPRLVSYFPEPEAPSAEAWAAYEQTNLAFAEAAAAETTASNCWIHDYQLALAPGILRKLGFSGRIGYFLHTPFPDINVASTYLTGSARQQLSATMSGILGADLAGFQTPGDASRFRAAAVAFGLASQRGDQLLVDGRPVAVGAYPVGIDTQEVRESAPAAEFPTAFDRFRRPGMALIVGLERSDYTKGIPERLRAVAASYRSGCRFAYLGVAAPTRSDVSAYSRLESAIAEASDEAAEAARMAEVPFAHVHKALPASAILALQRDADLVFTSSLADGMNLVPLQAAIAQSIRVPGERGALIAGRDAGVASIYARFEDDGLTVVDPLDGPRMREILESAVHGALPPISDRLVDAVAKHDAHSWANHFLSDLEATC